MVKIVKSSPVSRGYRETNYQLAKENGEIKQLLGEILKENSQRREEIHRCHVRIIELEVTEKKYNALKHKYDSIVKIIENQEETFSITGRTIEQISQQSVVLPLPQASDIDNSVAQTLGRTTGVQGLDAISEHGEEEELEEEEEDIDSVEYVDDDDKNVTFNRSTPDQQKTYEEDQHHEDPKSLYDSLEPPDVTSVPPLDKSLTPEPATLSIWKCLDETTIAPIENDSDMFQSTPKRPVLHNADSRVNMSPVTKDDKQQQRHCCLQQEQQHIHIPSPQQEQSQQQLQLEVQVEVTKSKRKKSKQKDEEGAAKRPRTYNLRKRK